MNFDREHLGYVRKQIMALKPLNCIFWSKEINKHTRIQEYTLPELIRKEEEAKVLQYYLDILPEDDIKAVYSYETSIGLRYIGLSMQVKGDYKGHIILGPYLNCLLEDIEIQRILSDKVMNFKEKCELKEFYKRIPAIGVIEEITLGKVAYTLLQVGDMDIRYITPDGHSERKSIQGNQEKQIKAKEWKASYQIDTYNIEELETVKTCLAEKEIIYYIYQGDWQRALKTLMNINGSFIEKATDSPITNFKNLILTLNGMIRYALINCSIDIKRLRSITTKVCKKVNDAHKTGELQLILKEMIIEYCELVNEIKDNNYSQIVLGATRYIRFNFDKKITLKGLAEELYVHPNYLSRRFREETGCQISDYINQVRIEQAQLLLNNPTLSISEIAYKVGYNDEKYFSKVFKKYNDKTPSEYRSS